MPETTPTTDHEQQPKPPKWAGGPNYRKRPIVIQAVQLHATEPGEPLTFDHSTDWLQKAFDDGVLERRYGDAINGGDWDFVAVRTLEGEMLAAPDDFIIRGVQGELYPCKPDIFRATYEATEDAA